MKFFPSFVALSLVLSASLSVAAPTHAVKRENAKKGGNSGAASASVGAVYFITNDEQGNFIVASDIGADGKLSSARAFSAGGRGLHGKSAALGPDGLFSQGSIKVLGSNVFTVNTGSNTVSMFAIDSKTPSKLSMVGNPVSSQGEFPVSLAVSAASGNVCVLNGGQFNSVACFKPSKQGLLSITNSFRQLGLNQTAGAPTGPPGTVSHVLFNVDGSKLVASVKGAPPNPGFLAVWDVAGDGSLSEQFNAVTPPTGGLLPFGMNNFPHGPMTLVVTDPGIGFNVIDVDAALAQGGSGTTAITSLAASNAVAAGRSSANKIDGQAAVCWTAFSPKLNHFYMTDVGTSTVTEVAVDSASLKATIVKQYPLGAGIATIDDEVATIRGKDFLYVLAANATSVEVMSLNGPGAARRIQSFKLKASQFKGGINLNPNNLQGMATFVKK